ncbi:hypothetical protein BsWGS_25632 [Bradybaena similaris]
MSRRQQQLAARKPPHTWQQDLREKQILDKIDAQSKTTENIIARLRARLEVLDLVVDKSLPEETFLARKEINPWRFRRNDRLNNKWTFVNNMVTMQEFLVAATDARKRLDEARATSANSKQQQMTVTMSEKASTSDAQSAMNLPSISRKDTHEADNEEVDKEEADKEEAGKEEVGNIAIHSSHGLPKETVKVRNQDKGLRKTEPETSADHSNLNSDTSLPIRRVENIPITMESILKYEKHNVVLCSSIEDNYVVLPTIMFDDSKENTDADLKEIPAISSKNNVFLTIPSQLNGTRGFNKEFIKLDKNLNRNKQRKQKRRPSLKPISFSKFRTTERDFEEILAFSWSPQPAIQICQYCRKSVCVGQQFKKYLGEKNPDTGLPQSQLSARMKQRIADITAIYGFV